VIAGSLLVGLLSAEPALAIAPAGSFIKVTGADPIYVVVGGAAIHVDSCAPLGGCPGVQMIPSLAGYAAVPANGSFVRVQDGPSAGFIGTVVGGAVIHVDSCAPLNGCPGVVGLDSGGAAAYMGAHPLPANGSFVRIADGVNAGLIRRAAGGAFLPVTDCAPLGGCLGPVSVDSGGFAAYMAAHPVPADGTLLRGLPSQSVWVVLGGQREPAGDNPAAVAVDDASLAAIPVASPATTGAGTTTPSPSPAPPRRGIQRRLRVKLALSWQWSRNRTRLLGLTIGRHPRTVRITVTCRGKGCPLPARSATYRGLPRLRLVLDGRVYRAGDRLLITLRARGYSAERVEVRIRDGKIPRAQLL
jgi:hypothetical protein